MTSSHHGPYALGYTHATMAGTMGCEIARWSQSHPRRLPPRRVDPATSSVTDFHDVTGGVYNPRERIHRSVLTCGY